MYVLRFFCLFFCVCFFVLFFLLQNAPIATIFDDAIYLFFFLFFFLHFISMLLGPSPILKTIQKMGDRNEKKPLQQQTNNYHTSNVI